MVEARLSGRELLIPALGALLLALFVLYAIGFDQGALASPVTHALSDKGGVLHEFFHDARHLLGIPCH
ncbi:MAG: CbtB domain-containing protein [Egibacteraceae bacterium]